MTIVDLNKTVSRFREQTYRALQITTDIMATSQIARRN
ncbi:uncharacterized protein FFFS_01639 [Fusarium fujikuroi]|nr:uncharacterized protein FFC1_01647 [Fusarium fujikuroi]SCV28503.1 uncharacterized protein FFFS_01639 [Fusarium fujikuroi]